MITVCISNEYLNAIFDAISHQKLIFRMRPIKGLVEHCLVCASLTARMLAEVVAL